MGKKKKEIHGIAKARQANSKRSNRAKQTDKGKAAKHRFKPTDKNIEKWKKQPGRSDIRGVDTKSKRKKKKK